MMMQRGQQNSNSGSAFILILVAIAMFAGLSYAVMQGGRTSAANLTAEQTRVAANDIIAFATALQKTVQTLRLRGVTETQFDFSNSTFTLANGSTITGPNATCTSNTCKVFNITGGRLTAVPAPAYATVNMGVPTYWKGGHAGFRVYQIAGIGTSAPDLAMMMPFLTKSVCAKINDLVGVTNPSGNPPYDNEENNVDYNGTIATFPNPAGWGLGNQATGISGKSMFCLDNSGSGIYYFYAVLLAR